MPQHCPFLGASRGVWITICLLVSSPLPRCGKCWAQKYILASSTLVIGSGLVLSVYMHEISGRMPGVSWMSLFLIPVSWKKFFSWKAEWGRIRPAKEEMLQETLLPKCFSTVPMAGLQERCSPICHQPLSASNNSYCVLLFLVHMSFGGLETCFSFFPAFSLHGVQH